MPLYVDACVVVKRYVNERDGGTPAMDAIVSRPKDWGGVSASEWILPEVAGAFAAKYRLGSIARSQLTRHMRELRFDVKALDLVSVSTGSSS